MKFLKKIFLVIIVFSFFDKLLAIIEVSRFKTVGPDKGLIARIEKNILPLGNTLVVFGLHRVLLDCDLESNAEWSNLKAKFCGKFLPSDMSFMRAKSLFNSLTPMLLNTCPILPFDDGMPNFIKEINECKRIRAICLAGPKSWPFGLHENINFCIKALLNSGMDFSVSFPEISDYTYVLSKDLTVYFSSRLDSEESELALKEPDCFSYMYKKGILCSNNCPKSEMLSCFLKDLEEKVSWNVHKVIIVDSDKRFLQMALDLLPKVFQHKFVGICYKKRVIESFGQKSGVCTPLKKKRHIRLRIDTSVLKEDGYGDSVEVVDCQCTGASCLNM